MPAPRLTKDSPTTYRPEADGILPTGEDFKALGQRAGRAVASTGLAALELMGRPAAATSEALGEVRKGEGLRGALEGAYRGLAGERPEHATLGKQIYPDDPGSAALVDFFGDPLMFVPFGKVTRGGLTALYKGGALAGVKGLKMAGHTPKSAARALRSSEGLQKISRLILPTQTYVEKFWGPVGKVIGGRGRKAYEKYQLRSGRDIRDFHQTIAMLGLGGARNLERRVAAVQQIKKGAIGTDPNDRAVNELARWLHERWNILGDQVETHRDMFSEGGRKLHRLAGEEGKPIMVFDRTAREHREELLQEFIRDSERQGVKLSKKEIKAYKEVLEAENPSLRPFQKRANYVPQSMTPEAMEKLRNAMKQGDSSHQVKRVAKIFKVTEEEADQLIRTHGGGPKRAGHIEFERTVELPEELLDLDPAHLFPKYANQVHRRLSLAEEFGNDLQGLEKLLQKAQKSGADNQTVDEVRKMFSDPFLIEDGSIVSADWARKIMTGMVVTKMGWGSTISNLSQSINTAIVDGGTNFLHGVFRTLDPANRRQMLVAYHGGLQDQLAHLVGRESGLGSKYLTVVGFNAGEMVNRVLGGNSGVRTAERLLRQQLSNPKAKGPLNRNLIRRGVTRKDVEDFRRTGKFSREAEERIGLKAANRTQHVTSFLDLPPAWRSPEMRIMMQYKNFVFQQGRFVSREVLSPLNRYIASGGKEGSVAPLFRFLALVGVAGPVVSWARQAVKEQTLNPKKKKFDTSHPLMELVRNSAYVGGLGIATDAMQQALKGEMADWVLGPAIGEGFDVLTDVSRQVSKGELPDVSGEDLINELHRRLGRGVLPTAGPLTESPFFK